MSCAKKTEIPAFQDGYKFPPPCIKMNATQIAFVTSEFTLGGLLGSMFASRVADSKGRRQTLLLNRRILAGIDSGVVEGLYLSTVPGWRLILLSGFILSLVQTTFLFFSVESPRFLAAKPGGYSVAKRVLQKLRGSAEVDDELSGWRQVATEEGLEGLISEEESVQQSENNDEEIIRESPAVVFHARNSDENFGVWKLLTNPRYLPAIKVLILVQLTQQLSGINGVMFYSTSILSTILPTMSDLVTVFISMVNVFMTVVSAYLIDKSGRRTLLLCSIIFMSLSSAILALSIDGSYGLLSAISIIGFVAAFAIGLGPIPFLIIPEIFDTKAAATAASLGLAMNWTASFLVAFIFPIANETMGGN
ncbi:5678_t:CDS:2, partial [Scutellospora calospora]